MMTQYKNSETDKKTSKVSDSTPRFAVSMDATIEDFIHKWDGKKGSERSNYQLFLCDLCKLLDVPTPLEDPAFQDDDDGYKFERHVTSRNARGDGAARFIDLYRRDCFVLEAKQSNKKLGSDSHERTSEQAHGQAQGYARDLPPGEGRPPFIVVVDVGQSIELYAEFSRSGGTYTTFPNAHSHRIAIKDLRKSEIRERLRYLWTAPTALDPANYSAKVTRQIADGLARLAKSLEAQQQAPEAVAAFLSRCLFTMFAEDVDLLPSKSFRNLLLKRENDPDKAMRLLQSLWKDMDSGSSFSASIEDRVLRFNGGLFKDATTLPLNKEQLAMLIDAAKADWKFVEPAIFGTLLERALSVEDRHAFGAHYTPRAYVERLVLPTVIEPLRQEWTCALGAARNVLSNINSKTAASQRTKWKNEALDLLRGFHAHLCNVRVLDPACGSGNFLYVTLDHMKRLEAEVLAEIESIAGAKTFDTHGIAIDPHQFLGIEVNPRAAKIAELVLWIGYLQWFHKTYQHLQVPEPVLRDFKNIENRDAVLAYDATVPRLAADGQAMTRWDGRTLKTSPTTGLPVPDESARTPLFNYVKPRKAKWPVADFIVGNPPFIGASTMRRSLGEGYVDALRSTWQDVPESADFVMYWWRHAALAIQTGNARQFGFITTNSLKQTFNRRVLEQSLDDASKPMHLAFAIPDHPWADVADGAAVRIAMTVGAPGQGQGRLLNVVSETQSDGDDFTVTLAETQGVLHADLRTGADVAAAKALKANEELSCPGFKLHGAGFIVTPEMAARFESGAPIKEYRNGRDLTNRPRGVKVIDLFGHSAEQVRAQWPSVYQHVKDHVKPERDQNSRATYRDNWWVFGEPRRAFRPALKGLSRYIATVETAKHRTFQFLDASIAPDNKLIAIALDDAFYLGVLSSSTHVAWAIATGGNLGVGNDPVYVKTKCFECFPFPALKPNSDVGNAIRTAAESLDAHRKKQLAAHPDLTLTGMYNALEKSRRGDPLTAKEKTFYEQGLVAILQDLHDELDAAVLAAYGWEDLKPDQHGFTETVLERLVALNAERTAEEAKGVIRWLRPEYQNPAQIKDTLKTAPVQTELDSGNRDDAATEDAKPTWPESLPERFKVALALLAQQPHTPASLAALFSSRGSKERTEQASGILATLESLGKAVRTSDDRYSAV